MILTSAAPHEIVYIDPPWPRTKCGTAETPYKTMSWDELLAFDLGAWLARDAIVFCWTTGPTHLKECAVLSPSGPAPR
jgi:N6-adenosine-specific RNA methylase IME4